MGSVIRTEKLTNYTKIDNTYLEDKNISLKANGLLTLLYFFFIILFILIIVVLSIIPTLVLRYVGLRKKYIVTEDEYNFTKYLYFIAMGISLVISLILTRFVGIIPCLLFNAAWALILRIYICEVKARCKLYALSLQQGVPYEQFVQLAPSNKNLSGTVHMNSTRES